jgi:hypothetical protein
MFFDGARIIAEQERQRNDPQRRKFTPVQYSSLSRDHNELQQSALNPGAPPAPPPVMPAHGFQQPSLLQQQQQQQPQQPQQQQQQPFRWPPQDSGQPSVGMQHQQALLQQILELLQQQQQQQPIAPVQTAHIQPTRPLESPPSSAAAWYTTFWAGLCLGIVIVLFFWLFLSVLSLKRQVSLRGAAL